MYAAARSGAPFYGRAVSGSAVNWPGNPSYSLTYRLQEDLALRPAVVTVLIGANDLAGGAYATTQAWLNDLWAYTALVKSSGARVMVGTILPQCGFPNSAEHNSRRAAANAAIRAAVGNQIDAVIDFAADAVIGPDAAACDTSLYYDRLHPTEAGQQRMAMIYTAAVDRPGP